MTDEAKALVGKLRERAAKVREWIISSQRVVDLLAPEMEKFNKREAPWDTYTVRMSVDHQSSIRTQTKEVEEYEQAADYIEKLEADISQLQVDSEPSPYCPICGSCGEEGCCGAKRCQYPDTGLTERIAELEADNALLREALEDFVACVGVSDDPDILMVDACAYENATRVLGVRG